MRAGWEWLALLAAGAAVALVFALLVDLPYLEGLNTYGDFDAASDQSFVDQLWPGTPDRAAAKIYHFDRGIHWTPIVALGIVFLVFYLLARTGTLDAKLGLSRGLTAWAAFVVARFGLLRVGGVAPVKRCSYGVFPFLNCQACEMASGGCPVGSFQASLLHLRFPLLPLVVVVVTGLAVGRWLCGWLCPFGMLSDIFDRVSLHRVRPAKAWAALKFVALGLIFFVPLLMAAGGATGFLPFCATLCPSGSVFGLLPYYATTGAGDFGAAFTAGHTSALLVIAFHAAVLIAFVWLAILISGRVFCRYLCPLGAFLGLFHKVSWVRVVHEGGNCRDCGKCASKCPMGINLSEPDFLTQSNCVRCGRCVKLCPTDARRFVYGFGGSAVRKEADGVAEPALSSDHPG